MLKKTSVSIIGGGPAGLAAAVQLDRYHIPFILFERDRLGGLIRNANLVENCPGFPGGIKGLKLADLLEKQARMFSKSIIHEEVASLDTHKRGFITNFASYSLFSPFVVVASGTQPVRIEMLEKDDNIRSRVFYEMFPLRNIKAGKIGIIGAGDAAFDYALSLSHHNHVIILNRGKDVRCLPVLFWKAEERRSIEYLPARKLERVTVKGNRLITSFLHRGHDETHDFDYIIPAVGRIPALDFLSPGLKKEWETLRAANKIFPVGDVVNERRRQFAIASGNGIEAAMKIQEQL